MLILHDLAALYKLFRHHCREDDKFVISIHPSQPASCKGNPSAFLKPVYSKMC